MSDRRRHPLVVLLLAPLLVPALHLASNFVRSWRGPELAPPFEWALFALFAPAIPLYLVIVPLFPFAVIAARRGWSPRPWRLALAVVGLGFALELLFHLGARGA